MWIDFYALIDTVKKTYDLTIDNSSKHKMDFLKELTRCFIYKRFEKESLYNYDNKV